MKDTAISVVLTTIRIVWDGLATHATIFENLVKICRMNLNMLEMQATEKQVLAKHAKAFWAIF